MEVYQMIQFDEVKQQIAKFCCFSHTKQKIKQQQPQFHYLWVQQELQRVQEAMQCIVKSESVPFAYLYQICEDVENASKDKVLTPIALYQIAMQEITIQTILQYNKEVIMKHSQLYDIVECLQPISLLYNEITTCIHSSYELYDHASQTLASIRKQILHTRQLLQQKAQSFLVKHANKINEHVIVSRNDRSCILIQTTYKNQLKGIIHGESASGQTTYFEPEEFIAYNNQIQALLSQEEEEVYRILKQLSLSVKQQANILKANQETLFLLDFIFAKAMWAVQEQGCVATISKNQDSFYIKDARHPLIDREVVVANTYRLQKHQRILLMSGSNTGGKTITLKTIALSVALTQAGFPILATEAILPFVKHIWIDIGDQQSIQESLSTFSSHICNQANFIQKVDEHSLVVIDELGSGTDPKEGECLAIAILEELRKQKALVIVSTHFDRLKQYAQSHREILLGCVLFDQEKLCPTYRYQENRMGESHAFAIAERYAFPQHILQHAIQLKEETSSDADRLLIRLQEKIKQAEVEREHLLSKIDSIKAEKEKLEHDKKEFADYKRKQQEKLEQDFQREILQIQEKAEKVFEKLKKEKHNLKPHEIRDMKYELENLHTETEEIKEVFQVNDYVCIQSLQYYGEIIELKKQEAIVLVNGLKMCVKLNDLRHAKKVVAKKSKEKGYHYQLQSKPFSLELNVIACRVDDAITQVKQYLQQARMMNVESVRIIHGVGTLALKNAIHTYLKGLDFIQKFEIASNSEGGLGATIVYFYKRK